LAILDPWCLRDFIPGASSRALTEEDADGPGNHHQGHPGHKGPAGLDTGFGTAQEIDGTALKRIHISLLARGQTGRVQTPEAETDAFGVRDRFGAARFVPTSKNNRLPAQVSETVNNPDIPKIRFEFAVAQPVPITGGRRGEGAIFPASAFFPPGA
jgi:hypothetical protein